MACPLSHGGASAYPARWRLTDRLLPPIPHSGVIYK